METDVGFGGGWTLADCQPGKLGVCHISSRRDENDLERAGKGRELLNPDN